MRRKFEIFQFHGKNLRDEPLGFDTLLRKIQGHEEG
jgi:hypothetical protein